jgi:hypothetical protein
MKLDKQHIERLFEKVDKTIFEVIRSDVNEAKEILADAGMDPDEEIEAGLKTVKRLQFMAKAMMNQKSDELLIEKALIRLKVFIEENLDKSSEVLIALLRQKAPSVQFRSLDKLGDDEIREILSEVDLAKLMEEIERESED